MKRTLLILFVAVTTLTSCKKDNDSSEGKLEGRWNRAKQHDVEYTNGTKTNEWDKTWNVDEMYFVFKGNAYESYVDGDLNESGTFSTTENSVTMVHRDGYTATTPLSWNSKKEFVLSYEGTVIIDNQTYYYKSKATFKKH